MEAYSPSACSVRGGEELVLTGSNFLPDSKVVFIERGPGEYPLGRGEKQSSQPAGQTLSHGHQAERQSLYLPLPIAYNQFLMEVATTENTKDSEQKQEIGLGSGGMLL